MAVCSNANRIRHTTNLLAGFFGHRGQRNCVWRRRRRGQLSDVATTAIPESPSLPPPVHLVRPHRKPEPQSFIVYYCYLFLTSSSLVSPFLLIALRVLLSHYW